MLKPTPDVLYVIRARIDSGAKRGAPQLRKDVQALKRAAEEIERLRGQVRQLQAAERERCAGEVADLDCAHRCGVGGEIAAKLRGAVTRDHRALPDEMTHFPAAGGKPQPIDFTNLHAPHHPGTCRGPDVCPHDWKAPGALPAPCRVCGGRDPLPF